MTKIKCAKCEEVLREGVVCIDCEGTYHRKCEKIKAGEGKSDYICKSCERKQRIFGKDNVTEVNAAEVRIEEPGGSGDSLRSEIDALKSEIASLKEIRI